MEQYLLRWALGPDKVRGFESEDALLSYVERLESSVGKGVLKSWKKISGASVSDELNAYLKKVNIFIPGSDIDEVKSKWANDYIRPYDDEAMVVVAIMIFDKLTQKEIRRITGFDQDRLELVYKALCRLPKTDIRGYAAIKRNIDRLLVNLKAKCTLYAEMRIKTNKLEADYVSQFIDVYDE